MPYEHNVFFTGREEVLQHLHDLLAANKNAALSQAISGLGGIGKTQTAIEYAHRHWDDYDAIFWAIADSDATLNIAYHDIAIRLNLPQKDAQNSEDTNQAVKAWLASNSGYLLVLDNADDLTAIKKYLPSRPTGQILVTSRAHDFAVLNIKSPIRLHDLPDHEALTFLLQRTERENASETERSAAIDLARELGYLPLALEQAGAYIAHHEIPFTQYLVDYRNLRIELLERYGPVAGDYPETIRTTWNQSFVAVRARSKSAAELLTLSAFFAPDAIPYTLLLDGVSELGDPLASAIANASNPQLYLRELLSILADYSLIHRNVETETYDIHRMVQVVIQAEMEATVQQNYVKCAIQVANHAFPEPEFQNWSLCDRLLPHALHLATQIVGRNLEFEEAASLLHRTGSYCEERALYVQAEPLLVWAVAIREKILGEEHLSTAESLDNLAFLYRNRGIHDKAEPLYIRALTIRKTIFGIEHPDTATSLHNLAALCFARGLFGRAKTLSASALAIREKVLGPEHPDTAQSLNILGLVSHEGGQYDRANELFLRALTIREKAFGLEHPETAEILNNLSLHYCYLGKLEAAHPFMARAVRIFENTLGKTHPRTAEGFESYALILEATGEEEAARRMRQRAKEVRDTHYRLNTSLELSQ